MKDFNENFKKELKEDCEKIEAKKTSNEIFLAYKKAQLKKKISYNPPIKEKKSIFASPIFGCVTGALLICLGIGSGYFIGIANQHISISGSTTPSINPPTTTENIDDVNLSGVKNQICFELTNSLNLLYTQEGESILPSLSKRYDNSNWDDDRHNDSNWDDDRYITKKDFEGIVDVYDRGYLLYDHAFNYDPVTSYTFIKGSFKGTTKTYEYRAELDSNTYFIADINFDEDSYGTYTDFSGEINDGITNYLVEGYLTKDQGETENYIKVSSNPTSYIETWLKNENKSQRFIYSIVENKKENYNIEVRLKTRNRKIEIFTDIHYKNLSYNFKTRQSDSYFDVYYRHKRFDGDFNMVIENSKRIYTDEYNNFKIIK
ncbi:MAG: hypothetical protein RR909_01635 [Bacilli bacterium]